MQDCPLRVSQIAERGGGNQKFYWGHFLPGGENLRMSDFDNLNLFQG